MPKMVFLGFGASPRSIQPTRTPWYDADTLVLRLGIKALWNFSIDLRAL